MSLLDDLLFSFLCLSLRTKNHLELTSKLLKVYIPIPDHLELCSALQIHPFLL